MQKVYMKIRGIELHGPCRLAPMASISNTPFRLVCKELGSSLTTSEEISAKALCYSSERTFELAAYLAAEKPIAMQIFGAVPEELAKAAQILEAKGADIIDLNMGCPVAKVTKTGAGSALMKDPKLCTEIFQAIRKSISIPFTIKMRGGWDDAHVNAPEISHIAESEGVDAIAVHPRTRSQQYAGMAPLEVIKKVVETVKIPVTGNGDIKSHADAKRMMDVTGCQSVMIGRGALGAPWVFDPHFESLSPKEKHQYKYRVIQRHLTLMREHMNPKLAFMQMKKHLAWYTVGITGASKARAFFFSVENENELLEFFHQYWEKVDYCVGSLSNSPLMDESQQQAQDESSSIC